VSLTLLVGLGWYHHPIEYLDITNNTLLGTLPEFDGLSKAQELKMGTNFFTGEIPESIGQLKKLQVLDLSVNFLRGEIPRAVSDLESLVVLKLGDNANQRPFSGFSGTLPPALSKLKKLARLEVYSNRFTGELPPEWGSLEKLQLLDLEFNAVTGSIPEEWSSMTSLQELYLSNTDIEGSVPESICAPSLQFFVVDCEVSCSCCSRCEGESDTGGTTR
jgi:Leucine-rich repeat (LRR) protein